MKRPEDTFVFSPELGAKLRVLRRRAGLTQSGLAQAMGRTGRKSGNLVGRLERGDEPYPSLGLIADYLRACRVGFAEILGFLDLYTARPTVAEAGTMRAVADASRDLPGEVGVRVFRYHYGVAKEARFRHEPMPGREECVRQARKYGLSQVRTRWLRRAVMKIITERGLRPGTLTEHFLQDYAAMVWRILHDTRGARLPKRAGLIEEATRLYHVGGDTNAGELAAIKSGIMDLFSRLEAAGELPEENQ